MKLVTGKTSAVWLHVLIWALIFSLPYLLHFYYGPEDEERRELTNMDVFPLIGNTLWLLIFYLNANVLVPRLLNKDRSWLYLASAAGVFTCVYAVHWFTF